MNPLEPTDEYGHRDFIFICPSNLECVLAAGDANDVPAIREWCAELPRKSYGRVFIEIESPLQTELIDVPAGVGVTWLVRDAAQPAGAQLMSAVDAWLDEWMRADPLSGRVVRLWSGARDVINVSARWSGIEEELADMSDAAAAYREHLA